MRAFRFPLAVVALLVPLAAGTMFARGNAGAYQHVANGGFEAGTSGWTTFSDQAVLDVVDASTVPPAEGARAARLVLSGRSFVLRQSSRLGIAAGRYHFSARFRTDSLGVEAYAMIEATSPATGPARLPGTSVIAGEWSSIEGDVDIPGSDELAISIRGSGNPGDVIYFDDVRLDGAPPATMTRTSTPTRTFTPSPAAEATGTRTPVPSQTPVPADAATGFTLVNGGFEDRDADGGILGWEKFGGSLSPATSPVRSGAGAARFESVTESTKWMHQALLVDGGSWYHFDAWVLQSDANVASAFLRISWYDTADASGASIGSVDSLSRLDVPGEDYRFLSTGSVAAAPGARSARVRVMLEPSSAQRASIYVDDAAFGPAAPAPATLPAAPEDADVAEEEGTSPAQGSSAAITTTRRTTVRSSALGALLSRPPDSRVVINEVLYDADGEGTDAEGEWVELYNAGPTDVDVAGWTLRDHASVDLLPALVIASHGFAVIAASGSFRDAYSDYAGPLVVLGGRIGNGLGNDGDQLQLTDAALTAIDAVSWGDDTGAFDPAMEDVPAGHSIERRTPGRDTDRAADFVDNESPSPGRGIAAVEPAPSRGAAAPPPVEILAAEGSRVNAFLYGALAASGVALVTAVAWRVAPFVRQRMRGRA